VSGRASPPAVLVDMAVGPMEPIEKHASDPAEGQSDLDFARHLGAELSPTSREDSRKQCLGLVDAVPMRHDELVGEGERRVIPRLEEEGLPQPLLLLGSGSAYKRREPRALAQTGKRQESSLSWDGGLFEVQRLEGVLVVEVTRVVFSRLDPESVQDRVRGRSDAQGSRNDQPVLPQRREIRAQPAQLVLTRNERKIERQRRRSRKPRPLGAKDAAHGILVTSRELALPKLQRGQRPEPLPSLEKPRPRLVVTGVTVFPDSDLREMESIENNRVVLGSVGAGREAAKEPQADLLTEVVECEGILGREVRVGCQRSRSE